MSIIDFGKALSFDGATSLVTIADNSAYSWVTQKAITIMFWMNPAVLQFQNEEGTGGDRYVGLMSKQSTNQNEWEFRMYGTDNTVGRGNRISFYTYSAAGGLGDGVAFQDTVHANEWIHITATVDANQVMRMYKNGILRDVQTSGQTLTDLTASILVGADRSNAANPTSFFQGFIDDVRIFNRVLTPEEINHIYKRNLTINNGCVGWWKFNEASGTTAIDSSTTANNGTITSASYVEGPKRDRSPLQEMATYYRSSAIIAGTLPNLRMTPRAQGAKSLFLNGASDSATQSIYVLSTTAFTIATWVKFNKLVTNDRLFDQQDSGPANGATLSINAGGTLGFTIRNGASNVAGLLSDALKVGVWYHVVAIYAVNNVKLYINGIQTGIDTSATMTTPAATFTIGKRAGAASNFMGGNISQFLVYNRAISEAEAFKLYFHGLIPVSPDLQYSLDNTAADSSGNGSDLTLSGTSYSTELPIAARNSI